MEYNRSHLTHSDEATFKILQAGGLRGYCASPQSIRGLVCIGAWGRSGSGLMSSMVDGHPEIVQIYPQHSLIAAYLEVLSALDSFKRVEDLVNAIVARFERVQHHPWTWTSLTADRAGRFSEILAHYIASNASSGSLTRRDVFLFVHAAFAYAMEVEPETESPLIIWQSHANDFAMRQQIRSDFPEVRFLVMARYPARARDSAFLAFAEALPKAFPDNTEHYFHQYPFFVSMQNLLHMNEMGRQMFPGEEIVAIRFEDLHMRTKETMACLADWLRVRWDDRLLESTLRGVKWGKFSMYPSYGEKYQVGTRSLTRQDFYTRGQSRIDLYKYGVYQEEFFKSWRYEVPRRSSIAKYLAMNVLCYWPVRLQWRTLRDFLREPRGRQRMDILRTFFQEHLKFANEFREFYRRNVRGDTKPAVPLAQVCDVRWPGSAGRAQ